MNHLPRNNHAQDNHPGATSNATMSPNNSSSSADNKDSFCKDELDFLVERFYQDNHPIQQTLKKTGGGSSLLSSSSFEKKKVSKKKRQDAGTLSAAADPPAREKTMPEEETQTSICRSTATDADDGETNEQEVVRQCPLRPPGATEDAMLSSRSSLAFLLEEKEQDAPAVVSCSTMLVGTTRSNTAAQTVALGVEDQQQHPHGESLHLEDILTLFWINNNNNNATTMSEHFYNHGDNSSLTIPEGDGSSSHVGVCRGEGKHNHHGEDGNDEGDQEQELGSSSSWNNHGGVWPFGQNDSLILTRRRHPTLSAAHRRQVAMEASSTSSLSSASS